MPRNVALGFSVRVSGAVDEAEGVGENREGVDISL
jgi:hypothetical protein